MWRSTRGKQLYNSYQAILMGLAPDGGLFIPEKLPKISFDESWLKFSYQELAYKILKTFLPEFSEEELKIAIAKAYNKNNFNNQIVGIKDYSNYSYIELYHGPTLAFKDMALTLFPYLLELAIKHLNIKKNVTILTATSGDTGGATLSGFSKVNNIDVVVLYPKNGVSSFQEKQMLSFTNEHRKAFAIDGNFDDCQTAVKNLFLELKNNDQLLLCSANSINIGRLLPQIVYYFYSYLKLINKGRISFNDKIDIIVPTGNFGNILAAFFAKKIGLPIDRLVCASNENNVLTDFFATGIYNKNRNFYLTLSPSMDILVSSNLERLIALLGANSDEVCNYMNALSDKGEYKVSAELFLKFNDFLAFDANDNECLAEIKDVYLHNRYLIDPHTAVAKCAYNKLYKKNYSLIISTASPLKFKNAIEKAINISLYNLNLRIPKQFERIINCQKQSNLLTFKEVKEFLLAKKYLISVPGTTANFCIGFDTLGMALDCYNSFLFYKSEQSRIFDFNDKLLEHNLIYKAYCTTFTYLNKKIVPIKIFQCQNDVFIGRGLGSSATCIVSGVKMALLMLNIDDDKLLAKIATIIEGHPDNVIPAIFGGFNASIINDKEIINIKHKVSSKLHFALCVPNFELSTALSRGVLPESLSYKDAVNNLSRIVNLPIALKKGDIELLNVLFNDRLHEPYRIKLISGGEELINSAKNKGYLATISGAGPTILLISKEKINGDLLQFDPLIWQIINIKISNSGYKMEEL